MRTLKSRIRNRLTKAEQMQQLVRIYKESTGEKDVDALKVAQFAVKQGWQLPQPTSAMEMLAHQFADAMRVETKNDSLTGRPYRVNHAYVPQGQTTFWFDIDDPDTTRHKMTISLISRREQMVGDAVQLTFDADHWNAMHPDENPITLSLEFLEDVNERKAATD
jgi:hypothetical protein